MPLETSARIVSALAERGYNAEREAITRLAGADDPKQALERAVETVPDDALVISAEHVDSALSDPATSVDSPPATTPSDSGDRQHGNNPSASTGKTPDHPPSETAEMSDDQPAATVTRDPSKPVVSGDIPSTGTGDYEDFVSVFRDRYKRLADKLRGRVNHRPIDAVSSMPGGSDVAIIGMISDIRSTVGGHWLVELEDTNGTFPCLVLKDREFVADARTLLTDEVVAVEGTLSDDNDEGDGILFVDDLYFPDVPRTYTPSTADRHVQAALVSDIHVGSEEFVAEAWQRFADWLHTDAAADVEYLLIAGDMVEGVGVYPGQDEELEIIDIYDQYAAFSEHLKDVPGDIEIVMIPGNHDAVRLAEPQPAFNDRLRELMSAHDARISANPSTVTVEGVSVLMYHGVSLDEVIAELPAEAASYERPADTMAQLLRKRHVAPQYGGNTRTAPEKKDHLVIEEVPDIFHTGHIHKLGYGTYHNVLTINSSCWQSQTAFQQSVNLDPDVGYALLVDLDTLDLTIRQFV